jgi:CMP-N-acetylneuraminic acid synthetase
MNTVSSNIALIPARKGSKRIPNKNTKILNGKPLIAYTIENALKSQIFKHVIVSTDDLEIANVAKHFGALVPALRPADLASDSSSDIEWVMHAIEKLLPLNVDANDFISILRPTSPLRTAKTIQKAFHALLNNPWADSLRALEPTTKHPGKMWRLDHKNEAFPLFEQAGRKVPSHNMPTQELEKIWVQNASLEIVRVGSLLSSGSISGKRVLGYEMPGLEGFDLNTELDWLLLETLIKNSIVAL